MKRSPLSALTLHFFALTLSRDPGETRTLDPLIKSQLLYQLSYGVKITGQSVRRMAKVSIQQFFIQKFFAFSRFFSRNETCSAANGIDRKDRENLIRRGG